MKDMNEQHDEYLPARRSNALPSATPDYGADDYAEPLASSPPPSKGLSMRIIGRALRRYWWQALTLWLLISGGLMSLAYYKIKPTYDAISRIRVEINPQGVYDQSRNAPLDYSQYMETQVSNLTSPTVIQNALRELSADPSKSLPPMLVGSIDPEGDVRRALVVGVVTRTSLIQVQMSSLDPNEGPTIVNAVVKAFLALAEKVYDQSTKERISKLKTVLTEQQGKVDQNRAEIEGLQKKIGSGDVERAKSRNITSVDAYRRLSEELTNVELAIISSKAKIDQLRNEKSLPVRPQDDASLDEAVKIEFYADPRVASLQGEREKAEGRLKETARLVRSPSDPARTRAEQRVAELTAKIDEFWVQLAPGIRRRLMVQPGDDSIEKVILESEANLSALKTQAQAIEEKMAKADLESKQSEGEVLQLEYRRDDYQRAKAMLDRIQDQLSQLEYEARTPVVKTELMFPAEPSHRPSSDRRLQSMAAAPVVTGLLILSLLVFLELRGARVADPDELSSRVNLKVIGVVPPLPQIRASSATAGTGLPAAAADIRAQRQLDEFVQSLDHLRVALCARRDPWGRNRHCVLITSACGSEGKTTLAAQLAERCVNAGLMTLLIDADLRNPTLSRMLDAPNNPGLINVLRGEVSAEDVVMVIGDAGGFHLLPAGNPRIDPSRLLASDRLGKLIAQARESFDMIIVDAPPVLPVPDALTIGRWTDGAVLAVRYDTSRFPLVERAHRRLAHVGVHVIGAVVNGVRSMDSAYGGYAYGSYGSYGTVYGDGVVASNGHDAADAHDHGVTTPASASSESNGDPDDD